MREESVPISENEFLREVFDAIPAMVLVVDADVRIQLLNAQASAGLGLKLADVRDRRTGDVLHCLHAAFSQEGCGRHEFCQDCVVRNAVILAMQGCSTRRRGVGMILLADGERRDIHLLISASPLHWQGQSYAVLTLEDVSDLLQLRNLLPICMHCHKIRDERGEWHPIADYFKQHLDVDFSHGICPACLGVHYPAFHPRPAGDA